MATFSALLAARARHRPVCAVAIVRIGRYLAERRPCERVY